MNDIGAELAEICEAAAAVILPPLAFRPRR